MNEAAQIRETVVLGIGNTLMGDEGVGVVVARGLEQQGRSHGVRIVDGGTGGFHLLEYFQDYRRVVLIDATLDGGPPGRLTMLRPRFSSDYPPTLTAHDIGLKDLIDAVHLLDSQPEIVLFTISVVAVDRPALDLSPPVRAAVPGAVRSIAQFLASLYGGAR